MRRNDILETGEFEVTAGIAAAEVAGADLPHQLTAEEVMWTDATLARPLVARGERGTTVQRFDRLGAE